MLSEINSCCISSKIVNQAQADADTQKTSSKAIILQGFWTRDKRN